ncbi:MAG: RNA polymerase sigma factor [Desulforegulaceae bacterium]|jgi:RNA polymerase sigma factor (sigma-70 family)|nr:RNA polymerase sigma factor [Desulforegulaceae bacterium]
MEKKINYIENDEQLITKALEGDEKSLEKLISNNQAKLYNLAFKMVMDHDDALDLTQEILIKIITNLSSFNSSKAKFTTWAYKIAVNHILNMKKKKFEVRINDFQKYTDLIENLPSHQPEKNPEENILAKEFQAGCMSGMVMCLERTERIAFILGGIFLLDSKDCSEIMDITNDNFRKKLSRAKTKLFENMNGICGIVNPDNKCRCNKKYKNFVNLKMLDSKNLRYSGENLPLIKEKMENKITKFTNDYYGPFLEIFRNQVFHEPPDLRDWFKKILKSGDFKEIFNI